MLPTRSTGLEKGVAGRPQSDALDERSTLLSLLSGGDRQSTDISRQFNDLLHGVLKAEDRQEGLCREREKLVIQERINQDTKQVEILRIPQSDRTENV